MMKECLKTAINDEYFLTITVAENLFDIRWSQVLMVGALHVSAALSLEYLRTLRKSNPVSCDYKVSFLENMSVPAFYFEQDPTS